MQQLVLTERVDKQEREYLLEQEQEFACIFEAYYKRVYNYIYYRINSHYTTEDLTSVVFEKVIAKIATYSRGKSPLEVWIFSIAKNVVNDYYRRLKKEKLFSLDTIRELVSKEKNPQEIIEMAETNDKLLRALNYLSTKERNIIALKFGANLKNKEIADLIEITESNVGVILYRAMKKLKELMEREESR